MTAAQAWKALAVFFGLVAALAGVVFMRLKWSRGPDFDLTGLFWVMANMGRLTVLVLFLACAGTALMYWLRAYRSGG
ncbi:MAG TPA: hypothetical protein VN908_10925 [Gemmatimonadales bacterium]|nr:hypothetical protein [Gemmatimonadales bacterium]